MRIFKSRLQKKLILSFLAVGIAPMVISIFMTTQIMSRRVEEDIKNTIYDAYNLAEEEITQLQEMAFESNEHYLNQPEFFKNTKKAFLEIKTWEEQPYLPIAENVFLYKGPHAKEGKLFIEVGVGQLKTLMAGVVSPIKDENENVIGGLGTVYPLGQRFEQNITRLTGVAVRIFAMVSSEEEEKEIRDVKFSPKAEEEIFQKHETYYDQGATLKGKPYAALCKPFMGEDKILGLMLIGIPKTYAFQTVLKEYLPFFLGIWILVAGALGYIITRGITNPISKFIKGANAIASGDLNQHIILNSKDEIGSLALAFNNMAAELKKMQKMQEELRKLDRLSALGQLTAEVAHEVKNPLGIIKNSAQILESSPLDEIKRKEIVNFIIEEAERINKVVDNFLQFAKSPKTRKQKTNIIEVLNRTVQLVSDTLVKNDIEVIKEYKDSVPLIRTDQSQLQQLFLNLTLNAIEAMPEGGRLKILTQLEFEKTLGHTKEQWIKIVFSDTGRGVSAKLKKKIFEPFYTTRKHGTGLGLSISRKIVENHGGKITLESEVGKGSSFKILLPV
ncbi:HAMP domain-containing protein [bacterium]|nr:HAMP domain-containing protein [bacterium]